MSKVLYYECCMPEELLYKYGVSLLQWITIAASCIIVVVVVGQPAELHYFDCKPAA